ncbi:anthranilate synthase family protein [Fodinicurvata sp. EGI_FJ10296]|uniref:anthranilate synthase family protein n=1 Tax=Fodinicurvata sp. EGI_FJ10296 TaxID=3231908 RepID=UPI0034540359
MSKTLEAALAANRPFCLLRREGEEAVHVFSGRHLALDRLDAIPRKTGSGAECFDTISMIPFHQIRERGFVAKSDGEPIHCLEIEARDAVPTAELIELLPNLAVSLAPGGGFIESEESYADAVGHVITDEIGRGEGANFVIRRTYEARIEDFSIRTALSIFRHLLENETGAYWTFLTWTGEKCFIGATPERHISYRDGLVSMNPISGTFRKTEHDRNSAVPALAEFLKDEKEIFELLMVVDEELKMMADLCTSGGRVIGPLLKEMSKVIHTEYLLEGRSDRDIIDLLRESMYAATVTGSPVENACRIIDRYETTSRGYYAAVMALIGRDAAGGDTLDAPITIRTAEIDADGRVRIGAGATVVRDSDPASETKETLAKAGGMLAALGAAPAGARPGYALGAALGDPGITAALAPRNATLSRFWMEDQSAHPQRHPALEGLNVQIMDNEDGFTRMLAHLLRTLGLSVTIDRYENFSLAADADIVIVGPGPGDPADDHAPKIARMNGVVESLLADQRPFYALCLGHQVLCRRLGMPIARKEHASQGHQEVIDYFGQPERVGFYNTFAALADAAASASPAVEIAADGVTGHVHAVRGAHFESVQFHPESILTANSRALVGDALTRIAPVCAKQKGTARRG